MRFKYYLRGAGIGIIVTTLVLMVAFSRHKPTLSADEIRHEASKLGMVMPSESASGDAENEEKNTDDEKLKNVNDEKEPDKEKEEKEKKDDEEESSKKKVKIVVSGGDYSDVVSEHLMEKGLIKDAEKYNRWLIRNGYDDAIRPGVYYIEKGSSYREIIKALTEREKE